MAEVKRILVGISGASGSMLAYHILQALSLQPTWEIYLTITPGAIRTWESEMDIPIATLKNLCDHYMENGDIGASCASGSFSMAGMIIIPCSMKTIAGIRCGYSDNLLLRSADVTLKEKRKLVLCFRENPLSSIHLDNLATLSHLPNVYLMPMMMSYYHKPQSIEDMEASLIGKILQVFDIDYPNYPRWR